jgi:glycosyltransferase involved in cell wall biosynthesis
MKIAFDHQIFTTQKYGGISRYIVNLTEELILLNQDVNIFSPIFINKYLNRIDLENISGYGPIVFPEKLTRLLMLINNYVANNQIEKWRPNVIHETYYSEKPTSNCKVPKILTVHDMNHEIFINQSSMINKKSSVLNNKNLSILRADHIICASENTKNDLLNYYKICNDKISVVYQAVDDIFVKNINLVSSKLNEAPYLLFVGKRDGYKNFKSLKFLYFDYIIVLNFKIIRYFNILEHHVFGI